MPKGPRNKYVLTWGDLKRHISATHPVNASTPIGGITVGGTRSTEYLRIVVDTNGILWVSTSRTKETP